MIQKKFSHGKEKSVFLLHVDRNQPEAILIYPLLKFMAAENIRMIFNVLQEDICRTTHYK